MRLIDADRMKRNIIDDGAHETAQELRQWVDNQTHNRDAIPVEWLRERKHWAAIDSDHWAENIINYLLDAWQKEQEAG